MSPTSYRTAPPRVTERNPDDSIASSDDHAIAASHRRAVPAATLRPTSPTSGRRAADRRRRASHAGRHLANARTRAPAPSSSSSARTSSAPAPSSSAAPTTRCRASPPTSGAAASLDLLLRQSRPGGRARRPAARHPARHRHAGRRARRSSARRPKDTAARSSSTIATRDDREAIGRRLADERGLTVDSALRSPRRHRRPGHGGARADRRGRPARLPARPLRRRRPAVGQRASRRARWPRPAASSASSRRPATMRRDRFGRRTLQTVDNPRDGRRRRPHAVARIADLPAGPRVRPRHDDRRRSRRCCETMFLLWERLKLVVEPTGALGAAAALAGQPADCRSPRRRDPHRRQRRFAAGPRRGGRRNRYDCYFTARFQRPRSRDDAPAICGRSCRSDYETAPFSRPARLSSPR